MNDNYLYSYISSPVDMLSVVRYISMYGLLKTENHKLETICKAMDIPIEAHNPLSDIRATRRIASKIYREFDENAFLFTLDKELVNGTQGEDRLLFE